MGSDVKTLEAQAPARYLLDQNPESWDLGDVPKYRRDQIAEWIYVRRADSFEKMTNLPAAFRKDLAERYQISPLRLNKIQGAKDTTRKILWELSRGDFIECVLIPANPALYGQSSDRMTLCVSSQVGCAYGCKFCASGLDGWKRNLTPAEIVGQILETERATQERVQNLVFMGMGEPLANFENLMRAIDAINSPWGLNIGARHITISTSGLVPQIRRLADDPRQLGLAISLHGASDDVRSQIMPVNLKYPVSDLMDACVYFQEKKGRMITFEYILLDGVNDSPDQAKKLAQLARRVYAKINVIPYNAVEGLPWSRPSDEKIDLFVAALEQGGTRCTVRREKGHDIDAACGQLRLKEIRSSS